MFEFEFQTFLCFFAPPPYLGKCPKFPRFLIMTPPLNDRPANKKMTCSMCLSLILAALRSQKCNQIKAHYSNFVSDPDP